MEYGFSKVKNGAIRRRLLKCGEKSIKVRSDAKLTALRAFVEEEPEILDRKIEDFSRRYSNHKIESINYVFADQVGE